MLPVGYDYGNEVVGTLTRHQDGHQHQHEGTLPILANDFSVTAGTYYDEIEGTEEELYFIDNDFDVDDFPTRNEYIQTKWNRLVATGAVNLGDEIEYTLEI